MQCNMWWIWGPVVTTPKNAGQPILEELKACRVTLPEPKSLLLQTGIEVMSTLRFSKPPTHMVPTAKRRYYAEKRPPDVVRKRA